MESSLLNIGVLSIFYRFVILVCISVVSLILEIFMDCPRCGSVEYVNSGSITDKIVVSNSLSISISLNHP